MVSRFESTLTCTVCEDEICLDRVRSPELKLLAAEKFRLDHRICGDGRAKSELVFRHGLTRALKQAGL